MKKSLKTLVLFMAVAFGILMATGTTSKAASAWSAELQQTKAYTGSIYLAWQAHTTVVTSGGHYRVYLSETGADGTWNEVENARTYSTDTYISNLSAGWVGYVKVAAWTSRYSDSDAKVIAVSDPIIVGTTPNVGKVTNLKQTGATTNSVTLSWTAVPNATSYTVYQSGDVKIADTRSTSYTVTGLAASSSIYYYVKANQVTKANQVGTGYSSGSVQAKTVPAKVTGNAITSVGATNTVSYRWDYVSNCSGYQFQLQNYKGKNLATKDITSYYSNYLSSLAFKRGIFNRYHVRAYVVINNTKLYGAWSDYKYFALPSKSKSSVKHSGKKITVKWGKIKGASGYNIYVSTISSSAGFKKIKSLGKKKTKYVIKKIGKKKVKTTRTYYVRIEAKYKSGKKTIKSEVLARNTLAV